MAFVDGCVQSSVAASISSVDSRGVIFYQRSDAVRIIEESGQMQWRGSLLTVCGIDVERTRHQLVDASDVTSDAGDMQRRSAGVTKCADVAMLKKQHRLRNMGVSRGRGRGRECPP